LHRSTDPETAEQLDPRYGKPRTFPVEAKRMFGNDFAVFPTCYGTEFVAEAMQNWLVRVGIKPIRIYPGSPWENGHNERFNGTLRREGLNAEWFTTTKQAQTAINHWLKQYNHTRPHQALNMGPAVPETLLEKPLISGSEIADKTNRRSDAESSLKSAKNRPTYGE
jgi:hypothetical protein